MTKASDLRPLAARSGGAMPSLVRMEARDIMPVRRGLCDFCGGKAVRGSAYCGKSCRVAYNNLLARQGKAVMQLLKLWRKHRGAKGTPGEGKIGEVAARVDAILSEDRERMAAMQSAGRPPSTVDGCGRADD